VPVPLHRLFDYQIPATQSAPAPGSRVRVPFSGRDRVGLVIGLAAGSTLPAAQLKPIDEVLDDALVPDELLALLNWATRYYAAPPGEIVTHALPVLLRRDRPITTPPAQWFAAADSIPPDQLQRAPQQARIATLLETGPKSRAELLRAGARPDALRRMLARGWIMACDPPAPQAEVGPELHAEQRQAVAAILAARRRFQALLLAGVTGSGKTEVYLRSAARLLRGDRQVLVLVPEIGLTPQFVRRVEARLGLRAHTYHSGLGERQRLATWNAARDGSARLLIGTRSAVFLPLARPALIVVDEEHDSSFKQFDGMRYHARDVAVYRASRLGIPVVLGTATPSLESLANVERKRYQMLELRQRATGSLQPVWTLHDPRKQAAEAGLTLALRKRIAAALARGEQVLIYRNRRGYAPVLLCDECGWHAECSHCSAHLTLHRAAARLVCHHCGRTRALPARCPECQSPRLESLGAGTERVEQALAEAFPDYPLHRADRDSMRGRDQFEELLTEVGRGQPCILVGTQMLAKGHHLPGIGLAIMLEADQQLFSADFRAPERLAQAVVQVAGRAGRERPGQFVLVTRSPDHPLIQALRDGDYLRAGRALLDERKQARLPPYINLAMLRAESANPGQAREFLQQTAGRIRHRAVEVHGPIEAILQRKAGFWRFQLWLSSRSRTALRETMDQLLPMLDQSRVPHGLRWHVDVDPLEL